MTTSFDASKAYATRVGRDAVHAVDVLTDLSNQLVAQDLRVRWYQMRMRLQARQDPRVTLLCAIPGVGPVTASAIVATVGVAGHFKSGRHFAAWLGFRIMAKAGALPREIQLRKAVKEQTRILAAAPDDEGRKQAMKKLADLQLRLDIEQEARRRFYR